MSDGRLILGLGAGEDEPDFEAFGDSHERATRIARMDEGMAIIDAGLRGERLDHQGEHLTATGVIARPTAATAAATADLVRRAQARGRAQGRGLGWLDRGRHGEDGGSDGHDAR